MLKKIYILLLPALLFLLSSCSNNIMQPEENTGNVTFSFQNTKNPDPLFFDLGKILPHKRFNKSLQNYDELKILCLDMTRFQVYSDFLDYWYGTNQEAFLDEAEFDSTSDDWDNIVLAFNKYTGDAFEIVGEYTFLIKDNRAKGTIYLNPGLNFFIYALRTNGTTEFFNSSYSYIVEDSTNNVSLYYQQEFNEPPEPPYSPIPDSGAVEVNLLPSLSWYCYDPDYDELTFDVYLGTTPNPSLISSGQTDYQFQVASPLNPFTTYYWRVIADDGQGHRVSSSVFRFTTGQ